MVLPVPTAAPVEGYFEFLDLSGYPALFDDLTKAIRVWTGRSFERKLGSGGSGASMPLPVHTVGAYEDSFVPDRAAFSRLDERFQLSPQIWDRLPDYRNHSFAVFKLASTKARILDRVHAMAFRFRVADPEVLFFPTVHVHGSGWKDEAYFDHTLYIQLPNFALQNDRFFIDGDETTLDAIWNHGERLDEAYRSEKADGRMRGRFGCMKSARHVGPPFTTTLYGADLGIATLARMREWIPHSRSLVKLQFSKLSLLEPEFEISDGFDEIMAKADGEK